MSAVRNHTGGFDWLTIVLWFVLMLMGWSVIYATTVDHAAGFEWGLGSEYGKQMMWIGVCTLIAAMILNTEGNFFNQFAVPIYGFTVLLLALVLVIGKEVNGAKAWFGFGSFGIQPAEFAKAGTALMLARFVSRFESRQPNLRAQGIALAILGVPIGLILLQPDVGSILVFTAFVFALYREGWYGNILFAGIVAILLAVVSIIVHYTLIDYPFIGPSSGIWALVMGIVVVTGVALSLVRFVYLPRFRRRAFIRFAIIGASAAAISFGVSQLMDSNILQAHHKDRIELMLGLADEQTQMDKGYNMRMAKMAVGSGGWIGKGFAQGPMTRYNFVPEQKTDFIFTTVGEEFGFLGCTVILLTYLFFVLRIIGLAERQRSRFSRCYGYCVASILFLHALINVGMVLGLAPVIGIPLPFFSYGGSSLMAFTVLIFIFLRLDAERLTVFR